MFKVYSPDKRKRKVINLMPRRILLVEDEQDIAELVALHLGDICDEVTIASDGHSGLRLAMSQEWALIVLDLRLPGPDGLQICRAVRRKRPHQPILILTSKSAELDRVLGLESGADDYLTKPFNPRELVARVKAILRRSTSRPREDGEPVRIGDTLIDPASREVKAGSTPVGLRAKEFDLLLVLAEHQGKVLSREQLLDLVWGFDFYGQTRTVDVHVAHLRHKLADSAVNIETVWGVGYKLVVP